MLLPAPDHRCLFTQDNRLKLADTLKAAITLDALSDAINQTGKEDLSG
jgi:hypothetical protein